MKHYNYQKIAPYLFLIPFFLLFLAFGLFPIIFSLFLSFVKWNGVSPSTFVGLDNYIHLFTRDVYFWKTLKITFWLLLFGSLSQHFFAIPLAITLNNRFLKGVTLYKTAYFLPYITSTVSVTLIFNYIFGNNYGIINYILKLLGQTPLEWTQKKELIPITIASIINWRFIGWNTVLYMAGLQSIPHELYEAAEMDGAGPLRKHFAVTIPHLMPIIFMAVSFSIIGGMQVFDEPFIFTRGYENMGGPGNAVFTSAFYILWLLQRGARYGRGSSVAWILFLIILVMTLVTKKITNKVKQ